MEKLFLVSSGTAVVASAL